jgi:hypothetical protein
MPAVHYPVMFEAAVRDAQVAEAVAYAKRIRLYPLSEATSPPPTTFADASQVVFFGPNPPQGKEANWVPTNADGQFEVLFRFDGPQQPLFDKTWQLPDITKLT